MSVTGARRRLKQGIMEVLSGWLPPEYCEELAVNIMAVIPKPEKCIMYKVQSPTAHVVYYQCSKCDGMQFDTPSKYCPHCARRIIATEDMDLWL